MKISEIGEDRLIQTLLAGVPPGRDVMIGPGDDCAVIRPAGAKKALLLKTDCLVEGIHFLPSDPPSRVGWKALARVLSDIAAMGGEPEHALITIFSPPDRSVAYWKQFYQGLARAARRFGVGIVGGETSRSPTAAIAVTLTGSADPRLVVTRSGGKPGDRLFVTGRLGGSLKGRHLNFVPRVKEGQWLAAQGFPRAMMDLSDGLGADLPRLAAASGCSFRLDREALPRHPGVSTEQALSDGEDYELLLAVPEKRGESLQKNWRRAFPRLQLTLIGQLLRSSELSTELPGGFDHFFHCQQGGKRAS